MTTSYTMTPKLPCFERLRLKFSAKLMRILLKYLPNDPIRLARLGTVELFIDNFSEAESLFKSSLDFDSQRPETQFKRGLALEAMSREIEALRCYIRAIDLHPNFDEALVRRDILVQRLKAAPGRTAGQRSGDSAASGIDDAVACYKEAQALIGFQSRRFRFDVVATQTSCTNSRALNMPTSKHRRGFQLI